MRAPALFAAVLLVGACGAEPPSVATMPAPSRVRPPPVLLRAGAHEISLAAWTYCWSGGGGGECADGLPPERPPDIGDPQEVQLEFPNAGWRFTATAERMGERCGRSQSVPLEQTGPTSYRLRPLGPADDYVITLFGRGRDAAGIGGDLFTSFRWHTPLDGPNEAPTASIGILSGDPRDVRSYGVELSVHDLRNAASDGTRASVVVSASNGASMGMDLEAKVPGCTPEGSLSFVASEEAGKRAAAIGPAPFRYEVTLTIDSVTYQGRATWPADQDPECSPCTRLQFSPPLPGL